mmetsp:Transcript_38208/g.58272  ORF Transcript_38208/g.58272 Transcript_38208/m.58272 type:complete len:168 (-) Transcript_38208:97-600(-)
MIFSLGIYANVWAATVNAVGLAFSLLLKVYYGEADFSRVKRVGVYKSGFKEFFFGEKRQGVSVYYPMTKADYEQAPSKQMNFIKGHFKDKRGFTRGLISALNSMAPGGPSFKEFVGQVMMSVKCDVSPGGKVAGSFGGKEKTLIPIVYSHGLMGSRFMYHVLGSEFA